MVQNRIEYEYLPLVNKTFNSGAFFSVIFWSPFGGVILFPIPRRALGQETLVHRTTRMAGNSTDMNTKDTDQSLKFYI